MNILGELREAWAKRPRVGDENIAVTFSNDQTEEYRFALGYLSAKHRYEATALASVVPGGGSVFQGGIVNKIKTKQTMHEAYSEHPDSHTTLSPKSFEAGWHAALASVVPGDGVEWSKAPRNADSAYVVFGILDQGWEDVTERYEPKWLIGPLVRPLPQVVDLTVEEKIGACIQAIVDEAMPLTRPINEVLDGAWTKLSSALATGKTIDELCRDHGVPTTREA